MGVNQAKGTPAKKDTAAVKPEIVNPGIKKHFSTVRISEASNAENTKTVPLPAGEKAKDTLHHAGADTLVKKHGAALSRVMVKDTATNTALPVP